MEIFIYLIYIGGLVYSPDDVGFWKNIIWPFYLGKRLIEWIYNKKPA